MSDQGSRRYPRTFGGLVGSMIVLVAVVVPIVLLTHWFGDAKRSDAGVGPLVDTVDYRSIITEVQQSGQSLVYPKRLPAGWNVTSAAWDLTDDPTRPQWRLGISTPDDQFVGLYEQDAPLDTLLGETVDEHARHDGETTLPTALGNTWSTYSDSGGDTGYALTLGKRQLLVYGTSVDDLHTLMGLLTTQPLVASTASPSPHAS